MRPRLTRQRGHHRGRNLTGLALTVAASIAIISLAGAIRGESSSPSCRHPGPCLSPVIKAARRDPDHPWMENVQGVLESI
jgi:hypothetical protein